MRASLALIRAYREADGQAVIGLFREFMTELTPPHLKSEFEAYVDTAVREELSRIEAYYFGKPGQGFWVAEFGGVVGMVGIERRSSRQGELRRMAVAPAHRRCGIGRNLLRVAELFCRECGYDTIVLSTSELQVAAMGLYQASGYRLVRSETAPAPSHKSVGAGLTRHHYAKFLDSDNARGSQV